MSNFDYSRGYTVEELEALLTTAKAEREKYLSSFSDSGSSATRQAQEVVEKKIGGILDALEILAPDKYGPSAERQPRIMGCAGGVIQ